MDMVDKLREWGRAHGAARDAERRAHQQGGSQEGWHQHARTLRERADSLHREIYSELGGGEGRAR